MDFLERICPQSLTKKQTLWIDAKGSTPSDARLLLATAEDKNYETQVEVNVGKGNTAGLLLYYSEKAYAGVVSDGKNFTIYRNAENSFTLPNKLGKRFLAKIQNQGNSVRIAVSKDGKEWTTLVENMDVSHCTITTTAASTLYASDCFPPEKAAPASVSSVTVTPSRRKRTWGLT